MGLVLIDSTNRGNKASVSSEGFLSVNDRNSRAIKRVSDEFTRPANVTAYTAKDIVGDGTLRSVTLSDENGKGGVITKVRLMVNDKALTNKFRLHLFHSSPGTPADNAAYTILWANRNKRLGYLDFPAMSTEDVTGSDCSNSLLANLAFSYELAPEDNKLYYILETLDAFTPAAVSTAIFIEFETTIPA